MPTVTVIIPAYKHAGYILRSINSVLEQTYTDFELIVINDGSPDNTAEVVRPLAEAGRLRYIEQQNRGVAAARNLGIREARGKYVALLDDDDYWPEDKLEWQVGYLEEHPEVGVVVGDTAIIDHHGILQSQPKVTPGPFTVEDMLSGRGISSPGQAMARKSALDSRNGFNEGIWGTDDFDLWLDLLQTTRIVMVSRLALYYRLHGSNASRNAVYMWNNAERVVRKNLPRVPPVDRPRVAARAFKWLYEYRGQQVVNDCKARMRRGDFSGSLAVLAMLLRLLPAAFHDKAFFALVCRDVFVPARFYADKPTKK